MRRLIYVVHGGPDSELAKVVSPAGLATTDAPFLVEDSRVLFTRSAILSAVDRNNSRVLLTWCRN
jgi:hypothetical protein